MTFPKEMQAPPFEVDLAITIDDDGWPPVELLEVCIAEVAYTTFVLLTAILNLEPQTKAVVEVSVVFANDRAVQALNRDYRQKDRPTNILSFPDTTLDADNLAQASKMGEPLMFGDIILARETVASEAADQHKDLKDHMIHLIVHGLLHLAGYDHMEQNEADEMENLEIVILEKLGVSNPYILS